MEHIRIEHSNQQLLYHQCLHILGFTQHTQVPCMSQAFNMQRASERRQKRWIQSVTDGMQKWYKTTCRKRSPSTSPNRMRNNPPH